nr:mediator of rna polymerase ii transcription subunit 17 [Quercus suber]
MDGKLEVSLDRLPVKRLDAIEENGLEHFPPDVGYDERRLSLIRRVDFAWAIEKDDNKKQKKSSKESSKPWQWQGMVENLQLAHQELSIIIDLINTVEANDGVTVVGMTRPKPLPNEVLFDLSVSAATKLQCFKHLGKYFKQSAKALEQQVAREARFYGALIRLQQTGKLNGSVGLLQLLVVKASQLICLTIHFYISLKETHSLLREVHQAIFDEQVFDLVSREAFNPSLGVNVTGIQENYLQMSIGQGTSVFISITPSSQGDQTVESSGTQNLDNAILPLDTLDGVMLPEEEQDTPKQKWGLPNRVSYEIYLQQIFHEHVFLRAKDRPIYAGNRISGQGAKDGCGLLVHFCMSLAHRIFSNKVLMELDNVVCRVPYLQLISHPTWHSRTSSWTLFMKVPQSILHAGCLAHTSNNHRVKNVIKCQFQTKVVVNDDCINVEGEGAPNVVGLFKGNSEEISSMNRYNCDLADLSVIILQQVDFYIRAGAYMYESSVGVASQIIGWLHEEALLVGIKVNRDFLCLSFELEQGETLSLVAHVDPEDTRGCISWWLVMDDSFNEERELHIDISDGASEYKKFLGHLSLYVLYSTLMDLVSLCCGGGSL